MCVCVHARAGITDPKAWHGAQPIHPFFEVLPKVNTKTQAAEEMLLKKKKKRIRSQNNK